MAHVAPNDPMMKVPQSANISYHLPLGLRARLDWQYAPRSMPTHTSPDMPVVCLILLCSGPLMALNIQLSWETTVVPRPRTKRAALIAIASSISSISHWFILTSSCALRGLVTRCVEGSLPPAVDSPSFHVSRPDTGRFL
jgi:hypothetical protein